MTDSDRTSAADRPLELTTTRVGSSALVTVEGELDLHTARELIRAVDEALEWPELASIVIDLSRVSFLGSSGLGTLAELATRAPTSRPGAAPVPVRLVAAPDNRAVVRPWEVMNLQPILPLFPDVESALAA